MTDSSVVKAYSHPLRIGILRRLEGRVASPSELAAELGAPLSNTSYHVRRLEALGLVELTGEVVRRGAVEHRYTARVHTHYARTIGRADEQARSAIAAELRKALRRIERVIADSETRVAAGGGDGAVNATVVMIQFAGPEG